jgi:hypothetical protein
MEDKTIVEEIKKEEEQKETKKPDETKIDETKEIKKPDEETKIDEGKGEKYSALEQRMIALEEDNRLKDEALKEQTIKSSIMEKISDRELQQAVLDTGLVKSVEDIDKVLKIVQLSTTLNKNKFADGYKPTDEKQTDAYQQAAAKGDIFNMIKHKMMSKK